MEYKFDISKPLGDNDVVLTGTLTEEGEACLEDISLKGESIYEMIASIAMKANPKNGFTIIERYFEELVADDSLEILVQERMGRAEFEQELRDDR